MPNINRTDANYNRYSSQTKPKTRKQLKQMAEAFKAREEWRHQRNEKSLSIMMAKQQSKTQNNN